MRIVIDGHEKAVPLSEEKTVSEAAVVLSKCLSQEDKVASSIKIDGALLSRDTEDSLGGKILDEVKVIDVTTDTPEKLAIRTLQKAHSYLPRLSRELKEVSSFLRVTPNEEDFDRLGECLRGLDTIIVLLQDVKELMDLNFESIRIGEKTVEEMNGELMELLEQTKDAFQNKDLIMIGDLLEYEISPRIDERTKLVEELLEIAADKI